MTDETMIPESVFDRTFYLADNPDVAAAGVDPWEHFQRWGRKEGRIWAGAARPIERLVRNRPSLIPELLGNVPDELWEGLLGDVEVWQTLEAMVHPEFYVAQLAEPGEDSDPGVQAGVTEESERLSHYRPDTDAPAWTVDDVLEHYLATGHRDGLRPTVLFHDEWYRESVERELQAAVEGPAFIHWLVRGRVEQISPTPLFSEAVYVARHRDMASLKKWSFRHYVDHGAYEVFRRASDIPMNLVASSSARKLRRPLVLDLLVRDADVDQLRTSTPLEELAILAARRRARLESPIMRDMAEKAYRIEPLIRRPYGPRAISVPPMLNHATELARRGEQIRRDFGITSIDTIVLVPHVRMAGSARVAGVLTRALRHLDPTGSVLVLTTESDTFDRPDWFAVDVLVADVSAHFPGLPEDVATRLLLDVVRGLQPRRVLNVNSRRGWELFRSFGRQLAAVMDLFAYLFTWDLDLHGNKGGYPITYFPECFGRLRGVIVDSAPLRDELVARYGHSRVLAARITLAHTPYEAEGESIDHSAVFASRRERGVRRRIVWCGRFDRQKRFDLVVELARELPDDEFWVWGKEVLGGLEIDMTALPENIRLQGTYREFDDLPFESADLFLYTAQWDGVPTVLIDAGIRGIAVVASDVGGVSDVITPETGYLVEDFDDVSSYVKTIESMTAEPTEVTRRARALREHVRTLSALDNYRAKVGGALGLPVTDESEAQS